MSELYIDQLGRVVTTVTEEVRLGCSGCMYYTPNVYDCTKNMPVEHLTKGRAESFCNTYKTIYIEVKDE
jgi:hypothetical protein